MYKAPPEFGINGEPLRNQVRAGLELYVLTAEPMPARLGERQSAMIAATVQTIRQELNR
ncbi:MAG: hypothetical protein H6642_18245 [Caldilineaceae bacterium]|nr:hypothetical protein [Caldilineaceae bacterium]MCB9140285.1 hypothetical protein [Caldilineaceae bacterium]